MKSCILMLVCCLSIGVFAGDFIEKKELTLKKSGISEMEIDCGSGYLKITGDPGIDEIQVEAEIYAEDIRDRDKEDFVKENIKLYLEKDGRTAVLGSRVNRSFWSSKNVQINLDIRVPDNLDFDIDDGSGSIEISRIKGDLEIDDGSGSMQLTSIVGNVRIDDGSGSLDIDDVQGDVDVDDGSGSLSITDIDGSVRLSDGSGGIDIDGVTKDVDIRDSGSGSLNISNVKGTVTKKD